VVPLDKPPAVLDDRAEQILTTLGYTEPRGDTAHGLGPYAPYIPWIARNDNNGPHRWDALARDRPGAFVFWYRTSADARAAREGPLPGREDVRVRVEAASYRGRAVSFLLIGPWTVPTRMQALQRPLRDKIGFAVLLTVTIALLIGALLLARYNVRLGRADRRGATRVAVFVVCTELVAWIAGNHHVGDLRLEALSFSAIASDAVALGVILWIIYAALEPYAGWFALDIARRLLPQAPHNPARRGPRCPAICRSPSCSRSPRSNFCLLTSRSA